MKTSKVLTYAAAGGYVFFWVCGMGAYVFLGGPPAHVQWAGTAYMALACIVMLTALPAGMRLPMTAVGVFGFGVEVLGVHTGVPFGAYRYTEVFAPLLFGVPLVLASAWLVLCAYTHAMLPEGLRRSTRGAAFAAAHLTAIDFVLDPVAVGPMNLWIWDEPGAYYGIPGMNFAGWFATGLVALLFLSRWPAPPEGYGRGVRLTGLSIVLFFSVVACAEGLWGPAVVGAALLVLHAALVRRAHQNTA